MIECSRWTVVARMAGGLRRLMESIEYSLPPLDDLDFEMKHAQWYLDQIHAEIRRIKAEERTNVVRLVFGNVRKLLESD